MSLVWLTMSKGSLRLIALVNVRSGGQDWLKLWSTLCENVSSVSKVRVAKSVPRRRREIGRYLVPCSNSLSDFGTGIIIACFQMAGILQWTSVIRITTVYNSLRNNIWRGTWCWIIKWTLPPDNPAEYIVSLYSAYPDKISEFYIYSFYTG